MHLSAAILGKAMSISILVLSDGNIALSFSTLLPVVSFECEIDQCMPVVTNSLLILKRLTQENALYLA